MLTVSAFIETTEIVPFRRLLNDVITCGARKNTSAVSKTETIGSGSVRTRNQSTTVIDSNGRIALRRLGMIATTTLPFTSAPPIFIINADGESTPKPHAAHDVLTPNVSSHVFRLTPMP
jgi:hypothetical protein